MPSSKRRDKNALHEQFARIGKAVASPKRLELLDLLCQGERTVEVPAREANLPVANTSRQLQVLRGAHLAEAEKRGLHVVNDMQIFSRLEERRFPELEDLLELCRRESMQQVGIL
jgi:DNA-binding transcriptional ArsR family regulator